MRTLFFWSASHAPSCSSRQCAARSQTPITCLLRQQHQRASHAPAKETHRHLSYCTLRATAAATEDPSRPAESAPAGSTASSTADAAPRSAKVQTVDFTTLLACASGVEHPARIEQVIQYDDRTVCLKLRTPTAFNHLHLCWHQTAARLCLGQPPDRGATAEAFAFGEVLHSHLRGKILQAVALPVPWERVVEICIGMRPADPPSLRLYLEVMGRHSNLVLAEQSGSILACGYQVGQRQSNLRQLQVGGKYTLPPPANGLAPSANQPASEWRDIVRQAAQQVASRKGHGGSRPGLAAGMVRAFQGVSPALAQDICQAADLESQAAPDSLSGQQWTVLHDSWLAWLQRVASHQWAAARTPIDNRFSVIGVGTQPLPEGPSAAVDAYYSRIQDFETSQLLHQRIGRALGQVKSKLQAKLDNFTRQMDGAEDAQATQKQADLIMANLHRCEPFAPCVEVEDWDTGETTTLQLDPSKSAQKNAEVLYQRAGKQRRAVDHVAPLLQAAEAELEYLQQVELSFEQLDLASGATDIDALRGIREELVAAAYMRSHSADAMASKAKSKMRKANKSNRLSAFRQFTTPGGFPVLVGHNNRQNDELTHSVAKPADIWLHARGVPGAHALLQHPPDRADAPSEGDVQCAADLAAYFSKARQNTRCEVITTAPKHLSRPKGAKPGQVKVAKEQVVLADPQRSLAAAHQR